MAKQTDSPNLVVYNAVRVVPPEAQKSIAGGRLKGMTDINPMWRIKTLTEQFGMCGIGWKYIIRNQRLEHGASGEIAAFIDIDLFVKVSEQWSEAIPGTGGSMFVANEKNGPYTSDECFKMALTDAISVACKALGFGADIYWGKDRTKYDQGGEPPEPGERPAPQQAPTGGISEKQVNRLFAIAKAHNVTVEQIKRGILRDYQKTSVETLTRQEYDDICAKIEASGQSGSNG